MKKESCIARLFFLWTVCMEMENAMKQTGEKYIILFMKYLRKGQKLRWEKSKKYFRI